MKFMYANRMASHLGLFCLPMSHKKDTRLIWVNIRTDHIIHPNYSDKLSINLREIASL